MRERRILVVDDEPEVRATTAEYLTLHGFAVEPLDGGAALRARVASGTTFDAVVLDVTMPGEDGLSLARWLRDLPLPPGRSRPGIVMATARGETVDRIVGLELGADDYLPKPIDLRELVARLRAVLRRIEDQPAAEAASDGQASTGRRLAVGRWTLDVEARRLEDETGRAVALTSMEFDLLQALAERPDRVLTRDQLLSLAHKDPDEPFDRSIDIRVARLRRKIERDPAHPEIIKTVRGVGYVFSRKPG